MTRIRLISLATLLLLGVSAAPAAATLRVASDSTGLLVLDKTGFRSETTITGTTLNGDPIYVIQTESPSFDFIKFEFGPNCSEGTNGRAFCKRLSGKLNLNLGGGGDIMSVGNSGATSVSANLGSLNDTYRGISGRDDVFSGDGTDDIETGGGEDDITLSVGRKTVDGGGGNDRIDVDRFNNQKVDADGIQSGGPGNDTIDLRNSSESMTARGDAGDDTITMTDEDDFVVGGPGADTISSKGGDDLIESKELDEQRPVRDTVNCGFDDDDVIADLMDNVDAIGTSVGGTCEEVDRSPVGETPHVKVLGKSLRVAASGRVRVRLRCPRGVRRLGCNGRLQLQLDRRRAAGVSRSRKVRYRIGAGGRRTVTLRLSSADVQTLRRQRRRGVRSRGVVTSVERGRIGPKTTVRNPRLRVR